MKDMKDTKKMKKLGKPQSRFWIVINWIKNNYKTVLTTIFCTLLIELILNLLFHAH